MPMGEIDADRVGSILPLSLVRAQLEDRYTLDESTHRTGGPARYVRVRETGGRLGFITPLTHNFCESCNRVRLDLHRHVVHVPGSGRRCRFARAFAFVNGRQASVRGHRHGDLAQTQGARFHHRPAARPAINFAHYVADRRLMVHALHFVASDDARGAGGPRRSCARATKMQAATRPISSWRSAATGSCCKRCMRSCDLGKPIYGMNLGSVGFLMNEFREEGLEDRLLAAEPRNCIRCA